MPDTRQGKRTGVLDPAEVEHLDPEEGAGDRRAEDGREAGADAADHEAPAVLVVEPQDVGEEARDRRADLGAGPLLPDRPAEGERHDGGEELDGRDLPGDPAGLPVDRRDDGLGPVAARRRRERPDQPDADREREREEPRRADRRPASPA